jgi:ubiquinone/menaquinone biosynthesis C-methylase UbiE
MPIDLDQARKASREHWDRFAASWERERQFLWSTTGRLGERLVERLDPQPGDTVLELAAGTGDTGFAAAERIGDRGRLISTDFAPSMVEVARRGAERRGVRNVELRVLDAERIDLPDSSVDGVLCRFGYMLMADPAAALAETRRVLRASGRLSFAVWATPERNLWASIPGRTLVELGHLPPPEPGAPGIFAMGEPSRIRELVTGAGFGEPQIEEVPIHWGYTDAEEHWQKTLALAAPIAEAFKRLDDGEQERVRRLVMERAAERLSEGDAGLDGVALAVLVE